MKNIFKRKGVMAPVPCWLRNSAIAGMCIFTIVQFVWAAKTDGMSILIIGDSNTEYGYIAQPFSDTLQKYYGVSGSVGYIPLDAAFYEVNEKRVPGVSIKYPSTWKLYDMFEGSRISAKPYLSPSGHWLSSSTVGASVTVTFPGNAVDVYYIATSNGGKFTVAIDNVIKDTVLTSNASGVDKITIDSLKTGSHTMLLTLVSGSVTLLGFDAHTNMAGHSICSRVHNWGNGWSATSDFLNIDSTIFTAGLQKLAPDIVVVLLGTNDYLQDSRSAANVKTNLVAIINRIKAAGFTKKILLVSTFMTDNTSGATFVPQYRATSWPNAASETGTEYWDMSTWYGPFNSSLMANTNHCNAAGGKKIANEMLHQILTRFSATTKNQIPLQSAMPRLKNVRYFAQKLEVTSQQFTPYDISMVDMAGNTIVHFHESIPHCYTIGKGVFAVAPGMYLIKVHTNNENYSWHAPVFR